MKNDGLTKSTRKLFIPLSGFSCGGGSALQLENQISKLRGVHKVYVNPATEQAYLDVYGEFNIDELLKLIEKSGFKFDTPKWM